MAPAITQVTARHQKRSPRIVLPIRELLAAAAPGELGRLRLTQKILWEFGVLPGSVGNQHTAGTCAQKKFHKPISGFTQLLRSGVNL